MAAGETVAKASPGIGVPASRKLAFAAMVALIVASPFLLYPVFLMKVLCFSLFAAAFNLLIGFVGLLSFGHAAYFRMGSYVSAHAAKVWASRPSSRSSQARRSRPGSAPPSAGSPSADRAAISR